MKLKGKGRRGESVEVETPQFRNEAEERAWWDEHRERIMDLLIKYGRPVALATVQAIAKRRG
jgi:hypothetical protein